MKPYVSHISSSLLSELSAVIDPYRTLGISPNADETEINAAFKEALASASNGDIETVELAYDMIRSENLRIRHGLLSSPPIENLKEVRKLIATRPEYVGPGPWLAMIKSRS